MPRLHNLRQGALSRISGLKALSVDVNGALPSNTLANEVFAEVVFLESFKIWENFAEDLFVAHSRYNDPVRGRRAYSFLQPRTEAHALELLKLERDFMDWTSPDNIVTRAEKCFRAHAVITAPIKLKMQDLRDMKKLRNHIAHGSKESERLFKDLARSRSGRIVSRPGEFLNLVSASGTERWGGYYLKTIVDLIQDLS